MTPMARDKDRHSRPTHPVDVKEVAKLADRAVARPPPDAELSFEDLEETPPPSDTEQSVLSRSVTLHDPLTTSVLAEVARRSQTVEIDPDDVRPLRDQEEDDEPTPHPVLKRR